MCLSVMKQRCPGGLDSHPRDSTKIQKLKYKNYPPQLLTKINEAGLCRPASPEILSQTLPSGFAKNEQGSVLQCLRHAEKHHPQYAFGRHTHREQHLCERHSVAHYAACRHDHSRAEREAAEPPCYGVPNPRHQSNTLSQSFHTASYPSRRISSATSAGVRWSLTSNCSSASGVEA